MLAAAKEDAIEYIVYDGLHEEYPNWFRMMIQEELVRVEYGCALYSSEDGDMAIMEGDIFLLSKFGQVRYMSRRDFTDIFYEVN